MRAVLPCLALLLLPLLASRAPGQEPAPAPEAGDAFTELMDAARKYHDEDAPRAALAALALALQQETNRLADRLAQHLPPSPEGWIINDTYRQSTVSVLMEPPEVDLTVTRMYASEDGEHLMSVSLVVSRQRSEDVRFECSDEEYIREVNAEDGETKLRKEERDGFEGIMEVTRFAGESPTTSLRLTRGDLVVEVTGYLEPEAIEKLAKTVDLNALGALAQD